MKLRGTANTPKRDPRYECICGYERKQEDYEDFGWMHNAYIVEQRSVGKISKELGISRGEVKKWLKTHGLVRLGRKVDPLVIEIVGIVVAVVGIVVTVILFALGRMLG